MVNIVQPRFRLSPEMTAILKEFERLINLGCSTEVIKEQFVKDELLLMLMFYRQNALITEGSNFDLLETEECKEVEYV